jgi:sulfur-oxidizing protein SoxY
MNQHRRNLLKQATVFGLMASAGLITSAQAQEWSKAAFEGKNLDEVFKALNTASPERSSAISINAPDLAENGALVSVGLSTTLKADQMAILVEKNPSILAGQFYFPAGTAPFIATRIKMAQTSNVYFLVKAEGKWFMAMKEIKVTLGGCAG